MTVVLSDQEIDRAEAFRLSKLLPLDESIALNDDIEFHDLKAFVSFNGIEDYSIIQNLLSTNLRKGMTHVLKVSSVPYVDRLSHIVDVERPVNFIDLRSVVDPFYSPPSRQGMGDSNRAAEGRAAAGIG